MKEMKSLYTYTALAAALLICGCSRVETPYPDEDPQEEAVAVEFALGALPDLETDCGVYPMPAATSYRTWISPKYRYVVIKKVGTRWIMEREGSVVLDSTIPSSEKIKLTQGMPPNSFSLELRPGHYRIVAVVNSSGVWKAPALGTVVDDESDETFLTPPLLTYLISKHSSNFGYHAIYGEVFVATQDFDVPKTGDLHSAGVPPVALNAQRRVGKFRLLLKETDPSTKNYPFNTTDHTAHFVFVSQGKPFPNGIDAMGNAYYDPQDSLQELPWCMSTTSTFFTSDTSDALGYLISETHSTVFTPFLFMDPDASDLSFTVQDTYITGASEGYSYKCDGVFLRTLGVNKTTGIVFRATDKSVPDGSQTCVDIVEATDEKGAPENAAKLFGEFFEWNVPSYNQ